MRIESTKGTNEWKVWLEPDEAELLEETAAERSQKHHVNILLGTGVGLRPNEKTFIRPCDVSRDAAGNYRLRVVGKDTTGQHGEGKVRDAYLPDRVEREMLELKYQMDLDDREPYFDVTQTRVRQMVHEAAEDAYEETGNEDWLKVSSHDLRRYYAQTCLVRKGMNPRVVMAVGGWDSFEALKPYLHAPTPEVVSEEFEAAGFD